MLHTKLLQPAYTGLEARIFEMEPLADAKFGRVVRKFRERSFRAPVLAHEAHIEMTVVRRPLGFPVAGRRRPCARQVEQAVPMNSGDPANQEFRGPLQPEFLHLFSTE